MQWIRKLGLGLILAIALSGQAGAQDIKPLPWPDAAPVPPALDRGFAALVMRPIVLSVPGMDAVKVERNLAYAPTDDPDVRLDIYSPASHRVASKRPAVIFIHGGGGPSKPSQRPKDWGAFQAWGRLVAASGLIGVTFNHRLGAGLVDEAAADVASAIDFVTANADRHGIDSNRLCVVAFSGGGPLLSDYLVGAKDQIRCAVGAYAFMDLRQSPGHRQSEEAGVVERFSPITRLGKVGRKTPLLILRAGDDRILPIKASIDAFTAAALADDYPLTVVNVPGAPHGFDLADARPESLGALRSTLQFLLSHLSR